MVVNLVAHVELIAELIASARKYIARRVRQFRVLIATREEHW